MHIQKTTVVSAASCNEVSRAKIDIEKSAKGSSVKTPPVTVSKTASSISSLISSLGLPSDKLSASIISFSRFFSLPLKPELLASIRQQAFTQLHLQRSFQQQTSAFCNEVPRAEVQPDPAKQALTEKSSDSAVNIKTREVFSLAAAAAESKGVELLPKGLETFAESIDPEWQKRQGSGDKHRQRNKNQNEQKDEDAPVKTGALSASGLKQLALESSEKIHLLSLLNKLPNKNGQRWIVLPFDFSDNGRDFRVSMRILLGSPGHGEALNRSVLMALDITQLPALANDGSEKSWLFVMEAANNRMARISVYIDPEPHLKTHSAIKQELSNLMGIPAERISVKKRLDSFPCEGGCENGYQSIDEAV